MGEYGFPQVYLWVSVRVASFCTYLHSKKMYSHFAGGKMKALRECLLATQERRKGE